MKFPENPGGAALDLENLGQTRKTPENGRPGKNPRTLGLPLGLEVLGKIREPWEHPSGWKTEENLENLENLGVPLGLDFWGSSRLDLDNKPPDLDSTPLRGALWKKAGSSRMEVSCAHEGELVAMKAKLVDVWLEPVGGALRKRQENFKWGNLCP